MHATSRRFPENARAALADPTLQRALRKLESGFVTNRARAAGRLPEFEALRDAARDVKDHTLSHLDHYLVAFEAAVVARGGRVHWAETGAQACDAVLDLCRRAGARVVTKSKSMIAEEIGLNEALDASPFERVETDLGEYIIQIRNEPPSHIIAPAIHVVKDQVAHSFRETHRALAPDRRLEEPRELIDEARRVLRQKFLDADVGITGANFLVAETGTVILVTNEGNADLTRLLPRVHIVIASIEKVVPTLEDAATLLRVLARSATGQDFSAYTTLATGPRGPDEPDGPEELHVILLDNGRSGMLGSEFQEMLRCIRCGACLNHCPVYGAVGGHAYGWVYPGPMGAVLTPTLIGVDAAGHLPNASTFCGRCEEVCPVRIPLPKMMRHWREREFESGLTPKAARAGLRLWAFLARRPRLYGAATAVAARLLALLGCRSGAIRRLPLAGGWTAHRDFPAPEGATFRHAWAQRRRSSAPAETAR